MDVYIIGNKNEKKGTLKHLGRSLADDVAFIAENEKSRGELLTEFIDKDFVKVW